MTSSQALSPRDSFTRFPCVNAAAWQFPSAQGFIPVALLNLAAAGEPIGYDVHTLSLYDKTSVDPILKLYSKK
jgi:simple sugar transport system substrate-binding protein